MTAVGSMPELAFGNAQVRRQEASGESRGTVLTLACAPRQAAHRARRRSGRPEFSLFEAERGSKHSTVSIEI